MVVQEIKGILIQYTRSFKGVKIGKLVTEDYTTKVNKNLIDPPKIQFTDEALSQLNLIIENDYTLKGKYFRILISGKGCDGFTYSVGFTDLRDDDFLINIKNNEQVDIAILIDPFAAFYLQDSTVDFINKPEEDLEGFIVVNHMQQKYAGKFFKDQKEKIPPTLNV